MVELMVRNNVFVVALVTLIASGLISIFVWYGVRIYRRHQTLLQGAGFLVDSIHQHFRAGTPAMRDSLFIDPSVRIVWKWQGFLRIICKDQIVLTVRYLGSSESEITIVKRDVRNRVREFLRAEDDLLGDQFLVHVHYDFETQ